MPAAEPHLLLTVHGGEAPQRSVRFVPGQPLPPLTVGGEGSWRVRGQGIRPVHLTITFDGQQLYAASAASDGSTFLNGAPIDERWWLLNARSELRFGEARIEVTIVEAPAHAPAPFADTRMVDESADRPLAVGARTSLDAAGHWLERHQARKPEEGVGQLTIFGPPPPSLDLARIPERHIAPPAQGGSQPPAQPPTQPPPERVLRPSAAPGRLPSLLVDPANPAVVHRSTPPPEAVPIQRTASTDPRAAERHERVPDIKVMESTVARPAGWQHAPLPAVTPEEPQSLASTLPRGQGYAPRHGAVPVAESPAHEPLPQPPPAWPGQAPQGLAQDPYGNAMGGAAIPRASVPSGPTEQSRSLPPPDPTKAPSAAPSGLVASWRAISLPKKIISFLVPATFLLLLLPPPEHEDPAPAPRATTRPVTSGPAIGSAATNTAAKPTAERPAEAQPGASTRSSTESTIGGKTAPAQPQPRATTDQAASAPPTDLTASDPLERVALDAAFEGRWQDAQRAYERLAAAHPDQVSFREAARIIRENKLAQK